MTEIREAPRELVALALALRPDWSETETWTALQACRTAAFDWPRIVRKLIDLALQDEPVPTSPRDLWAAMRGIKSLPGTGIVPGQSGEGGADYLAMKAALRAKTTGPMTALRQPGEMELLREGPDP